MIFVRSLAFNILFFCVSVFCISMACFAIVLPKSVTVFFYSLYANLTNYLLKYIIGLEVHFEGLENFSQGACILASKHQSAWETIGLAGIIQYPSIVLKRELLWVPVFGLVLAANGVVPIDRKKGRQSLKKMIVAAKRARDANRPILIFPEGTRSEPGKPGHYHNGIASLYGALDIPVVPIALNSGYFWGRRSFIKRPGILTVRFLKPILPGLTKTEFMKTLESQIESACQDIAPQT